MLDGRSARGNSHQVWSEDLLPSAGTFSGGCRILKNRSATCVGIVASNASKLVLRQSVGWINQLLFETRDRGVRLTEERIELIPRLRPAPHIEHPSGMSQRIKVDCQDSFDDVEDTRYAHEDYGI